MSAALTIINLQSSPLTQLKIALNDKGLITELKYEDADCLIFTTPLLPDNKVLKIKLALNVYDMYYGDSWTSAETIVNQVQFSRKTAGTQSRFYCVCDPNWLFIASEGTYYYYGFVGKLDNDDVIAIGLGSHSNTGYNSGNFCYNVTKGIAMVGVGMQFLFTVTNDDGMLMKYPLIWFYPGDYKLIMNGEVPAKTLNLWLTSWAEGQLSTDLGDSYYLSGNTLYCRDASDAVRGITGTSLLVEFEP